jgi:hypothetical protein
MPRPIAITDEFAKTRGGQLVDLIDGDIEDRKGIISKIEQIRAYYYGDTRRELRYPGQVNMHLPVIFEKVEGLTLKTINSFYGAEPFVNVSRPGNDVDPERTRRTENYLGWKFSVDIPNSYSTIKRWVRGSYLDGPSVVMVYYDRVTRKAVQPTICKKQYYPGDTDTLDNPVTMQRTKLPVELLQEVYGRSVELSDLNVPIDQDVEDFEGIEAVISFTEDRVKYNDVVVKFYATDREDEVELCAHREIVVHDGAAIRNIEVEDLIVPYRATCLQSAPRVSRQYWLTIDEIEQRRRDEGWQLTDDEMAGLRAQGRSEKEEELINNQELKDQRDSVVGETDTNISRTYEFQPFIDNKVLIFEVYTRDDADEDGMVEETIYQVPAYTRKIVRADYLEAMYPHGRRPFPVLHGIRIDDRYHSLPIAQWLLPINVEVDTTLNQVHEAQEIINNPFFFYEPTAFGAQAGFQNGLRPGQGVPVMNAKGIFFPGFPQQPLANLSAIDSQLLFADRITMSPQSTGSSQVRNAPRTARGTLALLSEGSANVDSYVTEAQQGGWRELIYQVHALEAHFGPDEKWYWVTGEPKPKKITRADLDGKYEYIFTGNSTNTNKEVKRTIAVQLYQLLSGDPQFLQNPAARRELIMHMVRNNGEGLNVDRLDPGVPGMTAGHPPMTQEAENELILLGQDVDVLPSDDDAAHIQGIKRIMNGRQFEMYQPWQVALLASHLNKHARQMLSKQAAGAMQGGEGAGIGNNVSPTGGDLSALEGGVA